MITRLLLIVAVSMCISGCSSNPRFNDSPQSRRVKSKHESRDSARNIRESRSPVSFKVGTTWECTVSYYGAKFHGRKTANGEQFDMYAVSAAHKELPFNTIIKFVNISNGRKLKVRINDRGPFIAGREFDLSYGAAKKLDMLRDGVIRAKVSIIKMGEG